MELGGPRIEPIRLAEQHVRTLMEALPALCDTTQCGELYTRKDGAFRIRTGKTHDSGRLYHGRQCVSFKLADLRYMSTMLHMVEAQQSQYILEQADFIIIRLWRRGFAVLCWASTLRANLRFSTISCLWNLSYSSYRATSVSMPSAFYRSRYITPLMLLLLLCSLSLRCQ